MESDVISFEKTFAERFEEYKCLFTSDKVLPASQLRSEWSYIAELVLEPVGWSALWKIPADNLAEKGVKGSAVVLITVESVDMRDLTADVRLLNSFEKNVPKQRTAFLVDLYPIIKQENSDLYIKETADFIDKLRFFYLHLWMPWDIDDEENQCWISMHLESRLKLYYDMQNGSISSDMVFEIQYLISEGRRIYSKISTLEDRVEEDMNEEIVMCDLMDLHYSKDQIKNKFEMYEDPYKRSLLVWKKCHRSLNVSVDKQRKKVTYLIWSGGSINPYIKFLTEAKSFIKEESVKASCDLQECLNEAAPGDSFVLSEGTHSLLGLGGLEEGGSIRGVGAPERTVLEARDAGSVLLDARAGALALENVTLRAGGARAAVLVRGATLQLRDCRLEGAAEGAEGPEGQGLVALEGGCVVARGCVFARLATALHAHSRAELALAACAVSRCRVGLQIQDGAKMNLMKCEISECLEFGIKVEITRKVTQEENKVGSVGLLNSVGEVQLSDTSIRNNTLGDVCIFQRNNGIPHDNEMGNSTFSFLLFNNPPYIDSEGRYGLSDKQS